MVLYYVIVTQTRLYAVLFPAIHRSDGGNLQHVICGAAERLQYPPCMHAHQNGTQGVDYTIITIP